MVACVLAATIVGAVIGAAPASAMPTDRYLDLPLVNSDADHGPGGVNPALSTDPAALSALLRGYRSRGIAPHRYRAVLVQYWLSDTARAAGINLAAWNPRAGVSANRANLAKSYRFYQNLQLAHRELQWAGMGGLVGADFGGGLLDFELATNIYAITNLAPVANAIVTQTNQRLGPVFVDRLPTGLRALARVGATITPADLRHVQGDILVMQKNIFSDLMPMHRAYVTGGLPALRELRDAGAFSREIYHAWEQVAAKTPDGIAAGNARLLRREQGEVVVAQWNRTRAYKGDVGEALTYASTIAGSPSVAGVLPLRSFRPIKVSAPVGGRTATLTVPLPSWNWSVFDARWAYITAQLLPKYRDQVENHWPALEAELRKPTDASIEAHRPIMNVGPTLKSALDTMSVTYH